MSITEVQLTEPDLYGQQHPVETPELIQKKLLEFDQKVEELPDSAKVNLTKAQTKCPDQLTDAFKLQFLRCEVFRSKDAAKRYAKYWDVRRDICESDEAAFGKLTLDSPILRGDLAGLKMGLCQLLPGREKAGGRRVLFMDSSRQDRKLVPTKMQARAAAYMLMAALEDETTQQKGIVVLFWPYRETWDQPNHEFIRLMGKCVKGALPVRLSAHHICQPPTFFRMLIPLINLIMGERMRKRIRFHTGSQEDVQKSLEPLGITKDILPTEMGGDVVLDQEAWLEARRKAGK